MKELVYITCRDNEGWERGNGSYINFKHQGYRKMRKIEGHLKMDYEKTGDGIMWVSQRIYCITANPTYNDIIEQRRYDTAETLEDGEIVKIRIIAFDGKNDPQQVSFDEYRFHALGVKVVRSALPCRNNWKRWKSISQTNGNNAR